MTSRSDKGGDQGFCDENTKAVMKNMTMGDRRVKIVLYCVTPLMDFPYSLNVVHIDYGPLLLDDCYILTTTIRF